MPKVHRKVHRKTVVDAFQPLELKMKKPCKIMIYKALKTGGSYAARTHDPLIKSQLASCF